MGRMRKKDIMRKHMLACVRQEALRENYGDSTEYYANTCLESDESHVIHRRQWTNEEALEFFHLIYTQKANHVAVVPIVPINLDEVYETPVEWENTLKWEKKVTALTYASWCPDGDRCASSLIKAGADPSVRFDGKGVLRYAQIAGVNVRAYLFTLKLPLAVWIVKQVVGMRECGVKLSENNVVGSKSSVCTACEVVTTLPLVWNVCTHVYCEGCVWKHICSGNYRSTFACKICFSTAPTERDLVVYDDTDGLSPAERKAISAEKFYALHTGTHSDGTKGTPKKACFRALSPVEMRTTLLSLMRTGRKEVLFQTVVSGDSMCLLALYKAGIDVEMEDQCGETPLSMCVYYGHVECTKILLWAGANPNAVDREGNTLCAIAAGRAHFDVLRTLLDGGANPRHLSIQTTADAGGINNVCKDHVDGITDQMSTLLIDSITLKSGGMRMDTDCTPADGVKVTVLIDPTVNHPGAGACMIDGAFSDEYLDRLTRLFDGLTVPPIDAFAEARRNTRRSYSKTCAVRRYFMDHAGWVCGGINKALKLGATEGAGYKEGENGNAPAPHGCTRAFPRLRFLHYTQQGGRMEPHVDLSKEEPSDKISSTHTMILYLHDVEQGGETVLLDKVGGKGMSIVTSTDGSASDKVLASVLPKRGRLLIFPHLCPHEGLPVIDLPKLFLRGELS
eukprot:CFRG0357T1